MSIDLESSIPRYAQVEEVLAAKIADGSWTVGSQIPTEDSLVKSFDVSRTTIRKAIQNLADRSLVEIRRGRGTFVCPPKITSQLARLTSFVEDMNLVGRKATARLLDHCVLPADCVVAKQLDIKRGVPIVQIRRVRLADGQPISFDETYLPRDIGEKVISNDLENEPIFAILEKRYSIHLVEAEYQLSATAAEVDVARILDIAVGSPIFSIERTTFTAGNRPIDYERLYYRGDAIHFVTRLSRPPAGLG